MILRIALIGLLAAHAGCTEPAALDDVLEESRAVNTEMDALACGCAADPFCTAPSPCDVTPTATRADIPLLFADLYFPIKTKPDIIREFGALGVAALACGRRIDKSLGASGGERMSVVLSPQSPGWLVGTQGAGPCIGVAVIGPERQAGARLITIFHFYAGSDVATAMNAAGIETGSKAAIFGGDNSDGSNRTLDRVADWLRAKKQAGKLTIAGFSDTHQLWAGFDCSGKVDFHNYKDPLAK